MTLLDERSWARLDEPVESARSSPWPRSLRAVLLALPIAALAELLLVRNVYRIGVFIPKEGPFRTVYAALTDLGSFAFNLASVLVLVALGLLAVTAFRRHDATRTLVFVAFLASVLLARGAGVEGLGAVPRLAFGLAVLAVVVPFLRSGGEAPAHRVMVGAVAACLLLSSYAGVAAGPGVGGLPGVAAAQIAAELLVVLAAFAAPAAWLAAERFRPGPPIVAAPLAASFLAAWTANGAVTGILVLWSLGLRLYLAPWIYAIALWAFLSAGIGWLRCRPWRSAGLALLLTAGMLLGSTYQQAVAVVALVLITDGFAIGGLPAARRARSCD
jgi:hypothetical protein